MEIKLIFMIYYKIDLTKKIKGFKINFYRKDNSILCT